MALYDIAIYQRSLFTELGGDFDVENPPGVGATLEFDGGSPPLTVSVEDDDAFFDDGGADTGTSQTLAEEFTIGGVTYPVGSTIELEWIIRDDSTGNDPMMVRINNDNVGYAFSSPPSVGDSWTQDNPDAEIAGEVYDPGILDQASTDLASAEYDDLVMCFTRGALIKTIDGERAIETLMAGDQVLTMDAGYQPIRWIGGRKLDRVDLHLNAQLKPIRIRAGALGVNLPEADLLVSPQHRILVRSKIAHRMFDAHEVLVPAKKLLPLDGIDIEWEAEEVEYFHMLFDAHQLVWSNGTVTESLFTGPEALKAVSPEAREEIALLFPHILQPDFEPTSARPIPEKGKHMKKLVQRLAKNNKMPQEMDSFRG